jgi:hypothetical protein
MNDHRAMAALLFVGIAWSAREFGNFANLGGGGIETNGAGARASTSCLVKDL